MDYEPAMRRANELSRLGLGLTSPNPIVGAVLLDQTGAIIGEGFHQRGEGGAHAEIQAIKAAGKQSFGATLVVTLEPCNHHGKTPPCVDAIIEAGISKVVFATDDPNPLAAGGRNRLRAAGIEVQSGVLNAEVAFTNRAWLTKISKNRPYITLKIAATLDGKIAAADGSSKWITNEASRYDVAVLRSESDCIVTGTGTFLADQPRLTVRGVSRPGVTASFDPAKVVIGNREIGNREVTQLRTHDLSELIALANTKGWNRILVEAGPKLTSAFLKAGLFDEIILYQAPTILGAGANFAVDLGIETLANRMDLELLELKLIEGEPRNSRVHLLARSA